MTVEEIFDVATCRGVESGKGGTSSEGFGLFLAEVLDLLDLVLKRLLPLFVNGDLSRSGLGLRLFFVVLGLNWFFKF